MADVTPHIWALKGPKAGDYTQIRALAEGLGWPTTTKQLVFASRELLLHAVSTPTLAGLKRGRSDELAPPWPDLVLTAGRRNELVARWIAERSAHRTRIVHIGRPWSHARRFDLVVTTPQYFVPDGANVLVNDLPLHGVTATVLAGAKEAWREPLEELARPRVALLVGGNSGPFVFSQARAEVLARRVRALCDHAGASLLVSTSPRTPERFAGTLFDALGSVQHQFDFSNPDLPNPYLGYLAYADCLVVTSESVSMLAEAVATGARVAVFDVGEDVGTPWPLDVKSYTWKPLTHRVANAVGPRRMRRDVGRIHERLIAAGRAAWLGETGELPPEPPAVVDDALARTVKRVKELFE